MELPTTSTEYGTPTEIVAALRTDLRQLEGHTVAEAHSEWVGRRISTLHFAVIVADGALAPVCDLIEDALTALAAREESFTCSHRETIEALLDGAVDCSTAREELPEPSYTEYPDPHPAVVEVGRAYLSR